MRFEYTSEPNRVPLIVAGVLILCAVIVPVLLFRIIFLAIAAGPGLWAALQWLRRGYGLQIADDQLLVGNPLLRRTRQIPLAMIRGYTLTPRKGLAVAYEQKATQSPPSSTPLSTIGSRPALTDMRPETHKRPRYRLIVTSAINHADQLAAVLAEHIPHDLKADQWFSADDLMAWISRRRIRNFILVVLGVLGTPIYVIVIGRIVASFLSLSGGR
jgi:hypothetical protein